MSKTNTELLQKAVSSLEMLDAENIDSSKLNDLISSIENLSPSVNNGPTLSVSEKEDGSYHLDGKEVEKSFDDFNQKIAAERKKLGKVIVIDTETTGLSPRYDELLQLSIIDGNSEVLFNSHLKPEKKKSWIEAQAVNGISPEMVKDSPHFKDIRDRVQKIFDQADLIISYNGKFDTNFLQMAGINIPENKLHLDVMKSFAPVYGEKNTNSKAKKRQGEFKWQKLETAADHYNLSFNAHDSLEDVKATLLVAKNIYGMGLENLKMEDIKKNGVDHTLPSSLTNPKPTFSEERINTARLGALAYKKHPEIVEEIKGKEGYEELNALIDFNRMNPKVRGYLSKIDMKLGEYVKKNHPELNEELKQQTLERQERKAGKQEKPQAVIFDKTILPPFALMTSQGLKTVSKGVVKGYDKNTETYLLENEGEKLRLPKSTFETILSPQTELPLSNQFKGKDVIEAEKTPSVVFNQTMLPEFSILTQQGIKSYKDMKVNKYDSNQDQYILSNGDSTISVSSQTFKEITAPERFEKSYAKDTPEYEKLLETQYKDYFTQRENTAANFRHNFAVYCRKESNSPVDAVLISRELFDRMNKEEQKKTRLLMQQLKKDDETMTECLMRFYFEAVKEVPLNENYIKQNRPDSVIARPFYDTITTKGALIDNDLSIKIGDRVENLSFNVDNPFSKGKERVNEPLTIVSSSKEGNMIVMMNKDKSYYQIPRDEFLNQYMKSNEHQKKAEMKVQKRSSIEIER